MVNNSGKTLLGIPGTPENVGEGVVDPMGLLMRLLYPQGESQQVHPLIAQMLGEGGVRGVQNRGRQINEAVGQDAPAFSSGASPVTEAVPVAPQRSTEELLRAIDRMAIPVKEQKVKVKVDVVPVTVRTADGEELKYKDRKTGKLYDYDPNE